MNELNVNAVSQLTLGRSVKNHVRNCAFRSSNSVYQKPSVVDSHEICMKEQNIAKNECYCQAFEIR